MVVADLMVCQGLYYLLSGSLREGLPPSVLEHKLSSVLSLRFLNHNFPWLLNVPLRKVSAMSSAWRLVRFSDECTACRGHPRA